MQCEATKRAPKVLITKVKPHEAPQSQLKNIKVLDSPRSPRQPRRVRPSVSARTTTRKSDPPAPEPAPNKPCQRPVRQANRHQSRRQKAHLALNSNQRWLKPTSLKIWVRPLQQKAKTPLKASLSLSHLLRRPSLPLASLLRPKKLSSPLFPRRLPRPRKTSP